MDSEFRLGRALFLARDYDDAVRLFRLARAGRPSAAMAADIDHYRDAIRQARPALGSDDAIGPTRSPISISPSRSASSTSTSRRSSPRAARAPLACRWTWAESGHSPSAKTSASRLGGQPDRRLLEPRTSTTNHSLPPTPACGLRPARERRARLATYYRRWHYEGSFYNQGAGASLETTFGFATPKLALDAAVTAQYVDYGPPAGQNGLAVSTTLGEPSIPSRRPAS